MSVGRFPKSLSSEWENKKNNIALPYKVELPWLFKQKCQNSVQKNEEIVPLNHYDKRRNVLNCLYQKDWVHFYWNNLIDTLRVENGYDLRVRKEKKTVIRFITSIICAMS